MIGSILYLLSRAWLDKVNPEFSLPKSRRLWGGAALGMGGAKSLSLMGHLVLSLTGDGQGGAACAPESMGSEGYALPVIYPREHWEAQGASAHTQAATCCMLP